MRNNDITDTREARRYVRGARADVGSQLDPAVPGAQPEQSASCRHEFPTTRAPGGVAAVTSGALQQRSMRCRAHSLPRGIAIPKRSVLSVTGSSRVRQRCARPSAQGLSDADEAAPMSALGSAGECRGGTPRPAHYLRLRSGSGREMPSSTLDTWGGSPPTTAGQRPRHRTDSAIVRISTARRSTIGDAARSVPYCRRLILIAPSSSSRSPPGFTPSQRRQVDTSAHHTQSVIQVPLLDDQASLTRRKSRQTRRTRRRLLE